MQKNLFTILLGVVLNFAITTLTIAQCIDGDCENGQGIYIYEDHSIYIGKFLSGKANGHGTCYYSTGAKYVGEWLDHEYHGTGTYFYENKQTENGSWEFGELKNNIKWTDNTIDRPAISWAIVVGVANYEHLTPLNFPDDDAYLVMSFLKSKAGGALKDENIKVLTDDNATKANIIRHLHEAVQQLGSNDQLLFYFSGHGFHDALAPIDIKGTNNKLFHKEIINLINGNIASQRLCIVDACFVSDKAGKAEKNSLDKVQSEEYYRPFKQEENTAYIFSAALREASIENRGLRQGVFSHFLLKGLKGEANANKDETITIEEISTFVKEKVRSYTNNYQNPTIINTEGNSTAVAVFKE